MNEATSAAIIASVIAIAIFLGKASGDWKDVEQAKAKAIVCQTSEVKNQTKFNEALK